MLIENRLMRLIRCWRCWLALVVSFLMTPDRQDFCLQGGGHRRTQGRPPDAQRLPSPGWGDWPSLSASWSASCCLWRSRPEMQQHPAGSGHHRGAGRGGRHHGPAGAAEICGADRGGPDPPLPTAWSIQALSNPNIFSGQSLLGAGKWLSVPRDGALDCGHHQRGEPDRRPGRPGQRRVRHLRHHSAGDRPDRRPSLRWLW